MEALLLLSGGLGLVEVNGTVRLALALGQGLRLVIVELLPDDDLHRPIQSELVLAEMGSSSQPVITGGG